MCIFTYIFQTRIPHQLLVTNMKINFNAPYNYAVFHLPYNLMSVSTFIHKRRILISLQPLQSAFWKPGLVSPALDASPSPPPRSCRSPKSGVSSSVSLLLVEDEPSGWEMHTWSSLTCHTTPVSSVRESFLAAWDTVDTVPSHE